MNSNTYPKQTWGSSSSVGSRSSPIGGGGFVNPKPAGSNFGGSFGSSGAKSFKPNPFGTKQYSGWKKPATAVGTYSALKGGKKFGYRTPGYGTSWGTNFAGGTGKYVAKKGFSKKALGLGVAAGFLGGAALGAAGAMATYSVYHRYHAFRQMMYMRNPGMYGDWDDNYYRSYYLTNTCLFGCPMNSHCEWGFCECNAGTVRKYGQCRDNWSAQSMQARPSNFDPFKSCTESSDCMTTDMNLICNKNLTIQGTTGKCECRRDMKWNQQQGECQIYMDVDCSSITYDTAPSQAVLTAVDKAKAEMTDESKLGEVLGRTESANESLSTSLLTKMDNKTASDAELKEAFCRDIDSFSFEMQPPKAQPLIDERPSQSCSIIPRSACAIAYDSHDCSGGWKLVIPPGTLRFRWFTSYWSYRNDMDTIGIRAGCTIVLYSDSSFNGNSVRIDAYDTNDRWVVLGETAGYQHMEEDVESLQCACRNNQG